MFEKKNVWFMKVYNCFIQQKRDTCEQPQPWTFSYGVPLFTQSVSKGKVGWEKLFMPSKIITFFFTISYTDSCSLDAILTENLCPGFYKGIQRCVAVGVTSIKQAILVVCFTGMMADQGMIETGK